MAWWRATTRAGLRLWVLSMIAAALALAPSPCSPIEPGAGQLLQAPTSGESAVQYAALTAKQNSSECAGSLTNRKCSFLSQQGRHSVRELSGMREEERRCTL